MNLVTGEKAEIFFKPKPPAQTTNQFGGYGFPINKRDTFIRDNLYYA